MDTREILEKVKSGEIPVSEAEKYFRAEPVLNLGFARLDGHRKIRSGCPEVVFCENKEDEYLISIFETLLKKEGSVFGTRASGEQYEVLKNALPGVTYDPVSRIVKAGSGKEKKSGKVVVCSAGTADIAVAEEAAQTAEYFGSLVDRLYDVGVSGLHRLLSNVELLQEANCIVAAAGMEGALASVVAGLVANPVIALPTSVGYGASFGGLSALLTMLNSCANSVAVVNIDNGFGAGYLAARINHLAVRS